MYYTYKHTDTVVKSIKELIYDPTSVLYGYAIYAQKNSKTYEEVLKEFLQYKGDTDTDNLTRIFNKYNVFPLESSEVVNNLDKKGSYSLDLINVNTVLLIPFDKCNTEVLSISGKNLFVEQSNFNTFLASQLINLLRDRKYVSKEQFLLSKGYSLSESYPKINVWVYSRNKDKILNVTNFVQNLNISVGKNGGKFSLSLAPINNFDDTNIYSSDNVISESHLYKSFKRDVRNRFFFHESIITNDIVFIKFEELAIKNENRDNLGLYINQSNLAGQVYDMIGLVDSNAISISPSNNDVSINVSGRDLMKLLIEDGSYFMPLVFTQDATEFFVNLDTTPGSDKFLKRFFTTGTYDQTVLFANVYRSIKFSLQFFINQCANIGILPDGIDLFNSYKTIINGKEVDRRSTVFRLGQKETDPLVEKLQQGLWQIVKLNVDDYLDNRRLADESISNPDGSIDSLFRKICQEPFVEFFGDTYGDTYNLIVRQPPVTKDHILSFLNNKITTDNTDIPILYNTNTKNNIVIDIFDTDILEESFEFNEDQIYTWYQIDSKCLNLSGQGEDILSYIPVVYLPDYVNVWGNKRRYVCSNYISYEAIAGSDKDYDLGIWNQGVVNDLKLLLDSECYLPFTRKGTLVINGDRRIKRGTWIRHNGTKEIYYVENVINNYSISMSSIDRTTTLQLSRGMVEKYVVGASKKVKELKTGNMIPKDISYFDIVNTSMIKETILKRLNKNTTIDVKIQANFGVDPEIFDFFLSRRQFED